MATLHLAELAQNAGAPDGIIQVLPGLGERTELANGHHRDVAVASFTGSAEVGRLFMRRAGESNLKRISLKMGGKSPFIILEDANINDDHNEHAAMSAFWNGGQTVHQNAPTGRRTAGR